MKKFFLQVLGLGPAGLGPFLAADRTGHLSDLLSRGVVWFDSRSSGRTGQIGNYKIISNSPVEDYLEVIEPKGSFDYVLSSPVARFLAAQDPKSQIPLSLVGKLVSELQMQLATIVSGFSQSQIQTEVNVDSIHYNGTEFMTFCRNQPLAVSEKILLACGAREQVLPELACLDKKVLLSSDVICDRVKCGANIHIIGASHSAASVLWKLYSPNRFFTIWHRRPIRLFYASVKAAVADGYDFTETDICPKTGRVHRFGGVRPPYRDLFKRAWDFELPNVEFRVNSSEGSSDVRLIMLLLKKADNVIQAVGFRANRVPIYGLHEGPLMNQNGHLTVDERCRVHCTCCSSNIPGAYALGLGHQPPPSPELGGEPSYKGPLDGFNLYGGVVGQKLLEELLG